MTTTDETNNREKEKPQKKKLTKSDIKCGDVREEFVDCVLTYSKCVREPGTTFQECLKPPHQFPPECNGFRAILYQCKRSLVCIVLLP
jgi:hypothetical protein